MTRRGARAASAWALLIGGFVATPARGDTLGAVVAYKAGRYLDAAAEIQAVVDQSPGYAYGYFLLGQCLLKMGRTGEAELNFRRAVRLEPDRAVYYHGLALAAYAGGNWPLMRGVAGEGLKHNPDTRMRFALLALRGYAAGALRRWNEAVRDLEAAEHIHTEPWLLVFLGRARFATGAYAEAVVPLRQLLSPDSEHPIVLRLLAECFLRMAPGEADPVKKRNDYVQSMLYAQQLATVTPNDLDAVHLVGRAALGAGRLDQAENVFRHVLAVNPRQCYALANLGRTYMASARWSEAEVYLRSASACAPRLTTVYESLGDLYLQVGKPQDAAAMYRRAEEIEPSRHGTEASDANPVFQPR